MTFPESLPGPQEPSFERPERPPFLDTTYQQTRGNYVRQNLKLWLPDQDSPGFAVGEMFPMQPDQVFFGGPAARHYDHLQNLHALGERYRDLFSTLGIHTRFVKDEQDSEHTIIESMFPSVEDAAKRLQGLDIPVQIAPIHTEDFTPAEFLRIFTTHEKFLMPTQGLQSYTYLITRLPAWLALTPKTLHNFRERARTVISDKPIHAFAMGHAFLTYVDTLHLGAALDGIDPNHKAQMFRSGLGIESEERLQQLDGTAKGRLVFVDELAAMRSDPR